LPKRSSTNKPLRDWVFFTDRNLGNIIPVALVAAGHSVERHDAHFLPTTPDEEWLPIVAGKGWIALTHDKRIRSVPAQRDTAMRAGLALFILVGQLQHQQLALNLVATLPRIMQFRNKHEPPFIAKVHRPDQKHPIGSRLGVVDMSLSNEDWVAMLKNERTNL